VTTSFILRLKNGASAGLQGIAHVYRDREVRRTYRFLLLGMFLLSLLTSAGAVYAVITLTAVNATEPRWFVLGAWVLRVFGIVVAFLVSPLISITVCNLLFPVFSEIPFFAGLRSLDVKRSAQLQARRGLGTTSAIVTSLRRFGSFLVIVVCCALLGFVPVVGALLALPVQVYFTAKTVGWEMLDPYLDRLGANYQEQKRVVRTYRPEILGLGLVYSPLLSLPLVGPLCFGLLQAGAAKFVVAIMPPGDLKEDLLASEP
jgi:uncharacterized protein involved in cysteine biosynthesis